MTKSSANHSEQLTEAKLPLRDWILLPLLSAFTILTLAAATEAIARRSFGESEKSLNACLILDDPTRGVRGIPNSVCYAKMPENELTEYKFDCFGYRTGMSCGPKPLGTYRIGLVGSSVAMGHLVSMENSLATVLTKELSRSVGRKVEVYNGALSFQFPRNTALRFDDVLAAAQPDLILWVLTLVDVKLAGFVYADDVDRESSTRLGLIDSIKNAVKDAVRAHGGNPLRSTAAALRYFLYEGKSQKQYIQSYLTIADGAEGFWDAGAGSLRAQLSPEWEMHLREFEGYASDIERRSARSGVPFVAVVVPNRAQAAMISAGEWPEGFDPYSLDRRLSTIITSHGGTYIDILSQFRDFPNAERYYFPVDGHPNAAGDKLIAELLAKGLSAGVVADLKAAR